MEAVAVVGITLIAICTGFLKGLLKLLWVLIIGLPCAIALGIAGIVCCLTVIGIPIGIILFKVAGFVLLPFKS